MKNCTIKQRGQQKTVASDGVLLADHDLVAAS